MVDWGPAKRPKGMGKNQLKTSINSRKQVQINTNKHKKIKSDKKEIEELDAPRSLSLIFINRVQQSIAHESAT